MNYTCYTFGYISKACTRTEYLGLILRFLVVLLRKVYIILHVYVLDIDVLLKYDTIQKSFL